MPELKRTINATEISRDLRSGITVPQLMEKYRISLPGLRIVFRKLLNAGVVMKDELDSQPALYKDISGLEGVRKWLRTCVSFPVRICDSRNIFAIGNLVNISENGFCAKGVETAIGETKAFNLRLSGVGQNHELVFESKCQWLDTQLLSENKWVAGFEITKISNFDSGELQKLIRHIQKLEFERRINEFINATFGSIN